MHHAQQLTIADTRVDLKHPSPVRVYDCLLGGSANWAIDREFAHRLRQNFPEISGIALANRTFLARVVRHLTRLGVRQFVDIGSGVLSKGNTHQIADEIDLSSRVVYVENESVSFAHAEMILDEEGDPDRHAIIDVDACKPDELWDEALATGVLDREQPIAVLILSVLHIVRPEPDGSDIGATSVARYRELLDVGSYLGVSHVTDDGIPQEISPKLVELKHMCDDWLSSHVFCRSRDAIDALLGDFRRVPPGMVWTPQWHPEEADAVIPFADTPSFAAVWGGVGQKIR